MSEDKKTDIDLELKKAKILEQKQKFAREKAEVSWNAVAKPDKNARPSASESTFLQTEISQPWMPKLASNIDFRGKNLRNGDFAGEILENANFSNADLRGIYLHRR